ncbi:MAG: hypothetical protein K0R46_432 [Herbinix sp.]|jgi:hypothetical protein|nr:hypothetical protein [Herbinix sp.]
MKSMNQNVSLWTDITVENMEARDEYGTCFWDCIDCFCVDCIQISCFCISCIF